MAPRMQPASLQSLSYTQVASNLAKTCRVLQTLAQDTCVAYVLNITKNYLRPIWQNWVPSSIRSQLLEETAALLSSQNSDGTGSTIGVAPLYLFAILLSEDITKLRIELCCYYGCTHQTALLKFLTSEGKGLQTLELARSTLLRLDRSLLQSVLLTATSLRHLTLRNIASDSVLQIIGSCCPNLVYLDVSNSREVTDAGLKQLLFHVELRDKRMKQKLSSRCRESDQDYRNTFERYVLPLARSIWRLCQSETKTDPNSLMSLLEYHENRNILCSTLRYLNIGNTVITNAGVLLAMYHLPHLQCLGEHCHIGKALDTLGTTASDETFELKYLNTSRTTLRRLEVISKYFPSLQRLKISEPLYCPKLLHLIPKTVISLHLQCIPSTDAWVQSLYNYLSSSHGKILKDLSLRFFSTDTLPILDVGKFLPNCEKLSTLVIDGAEIEWKEKTKCKLLYLEKVQLSRVVTAEAVCNVLKIANLKIVHIYSCYELKANDITEDQEVMKAVSCLECIYIYETACLSEETLKTIISRFPNIRRIGNVRNCGLHYSDVESFDKWVKQSNFAVDLNIGHHWFCSECFPVL